MAKVCLFVGYYPDMVGGAEFQSRILADYLKDKYEVFYISIGSSAKSRITSENGIKIYHIGYSAKKAKLNRIAFYFPVSIEIKKIFEIEKPNIVYQRVLNSYSYYISKFQKEFRYKYLLHIADKYSLVFDKRNFSAYVRNFLFNKIRKSQVVFIVQNSEQFNLLANLDIEHSRINRIYNSLAQKVTLEEVKLMIHEKNASIEKRVLWIGSSRKVKRMDLFLELVSFFKEEKNINFVLIGRVENGDLGNELKRKIESLNNLVYLGEQPINVVEQELAKAHLTINTSDSEGFSNVFIQSWYYGVPVFSLNSDPDELISDHKMGMLFNNDFDRLKNSIISFLYSDNTYSKYSFNSYILSKKLFNLEDNCSRIESLFK